MPANGAASATASVDAVTTRLMRPGETSNAFASIGSNGCGAKMVRKAQNPANTTAAVRVRECGAAVGDILIIMHAAPRRPASHTHTLAGGRELPDGPRVQIEIGRFHQLGKLL